MVPAAAPARTRGAMAFPGTRSSPNRWAGKGASEARRRVEKPKSPERRGRRMAVPPKGCQAMKEYRKEKSPRRP